jgi:hypothetical protein
MPGVGSDIGRRSRGVSPRGLDNSHAGAPGGGGGRRNDDSGWRKFDNGGGAVALLRDGPAGASASSRRFVANWEGVLKHRETDLGDNTADDLGRLHERIARARDDHVFADNDDVRSDIRNGTRVHLGLGSVDGRFELANEHGAGNPPVGGVHEQGACLEPMALLGDLVLDGNFSLERHSGDPPVRAVGEVLAPSQTVGNRGKVANTAGVLWLLFLLLGFGISGLDVVNRARLRRKTAPLGGPDLVNVGACAEARPGGSLALFLDLVGTDDKDSEFASGEMPANVAVDRPDTGVVRDDTEESILTALDHEGVAADGVVGLDGERGNVLWVKSTLATVDDVERPSVQMEWVGLKESVSSHTKWKAPKWNSPKNDGSRLLIIKSTACMGLGELKVRAATCCWLSSRPFST